MSDLWLHHPAFRQAFALFFLLAGLAIGSFLNVCIYRIPRNRSLIFPGSACPACGHPIRWYENIPVFSWLFLRGRCSACRSPISVKYPLVELLTGMLFLVAYLRWNLSLDLLFVLIYLALLIVISGIDITHQIVPYSLTVPGIICGLLYGLLSPERTFLEAVAGLFLGGGGLLLVIVVFYIATKKIGMGGGDIMIFGMIGAYGGPRALVPVLFIASAGGILFFLFMRKVLGRKRIAAEITAEEIGGNESDLERTIYFGPFLALGAVMVLFAKDIEFLRYFIF